MKLALKSLIAPAVCLTGMALALAVTSWQFAQGWRPEPGFLGLFGNFDYVLGAYLFLIFWINTILATRPRWLSALVALPAAILSAWAIAMTPVFLGLLNIGIWVTLLVVWVLSKIRPVLPPPRDAVIHWTITMLPPTVMGASVGGLSFAVSRFLAGRPLRGRAARPDAFGHVFGSILGVHLVFWTSIDLWHVRWPLENAGGDIADFADVLWPIYLVAPAAPIACLYVISLFSGETEGPTRAQRLALFSVLLFFGIGISHVVQWRDWTQLFAWPARDFSAFLWI